MDWGYQSLVPDIGEDARAEDDVKRANWNLWSVYLIISFRKPSTPQAFLCWRACILSCSSFNVIENPMGSGSL